MDLHTALILLGVFALVVVLVVSFGKERIVGMISGKAGRMRSGGGGLVKSRDFFLGRDHGSRSSEPTLGRLDGESDFLETGFNEISDVGDDVSEAVDNFVDQSATSREEPRGSHDPDSNERFPGADADEHSVRQIDYWVRIIGDEPVERDRILAIYREHEYLLEHAHTIHGRAVPSGQWCDMEGEPESTSFTDVVMTLQLCDRNGPVTESELTRFTNLVFAFSESLDRKFNFQGSVEEALAQAARLDRFCRENDVFAIINIRGEGDRQLRGPEVLRAVEGSGMRYGDMKVFHGPPSATGEALFSLANMVKPGIFELDRIKDFTTPGLTLFMSVPRCPNPADVFMRMAYVARKVANQLGGTMLDQKNQPLDDTSIKQIRRQVEELGESMDRKGIRPGSEEALRLF